MYKSLLLSLTASVAIASNTPLVLLNRQITQIPCSEVGEKSCGSGCIDTTWTCCPDLRAGCPSTEYCSPGTNDRFGCCPIGEICGGPGGASTAEHTFSLTSTFTSVSTPISISISASTEEESASSSTFTETFVSTSGPSPTSAPNPTTTNIYTFANSSVVVLPTTAPNNSTTTSPPVIFTGGAGESYRAASPFHALGVVFVALFMI